jgi:hypothetical protein
VQRQLIDRRALSIFREEKQYAKGWIILQPLAVIISDFCRNYFATGAL